MAKSKRKTNKKNIKKYPPLSQIDKSIYNITLILVTILYLVIPIFILTDSSLLIHNSDVYAAEYNSTVFLFLPLMLYALYLIFVCGEKKTPIFGNAKINYFDTTKYKHVYPIFDKRYIEQNRIKNFFVKVSIKFAVIPLLLVILSTFALNGRTELGKNGIIKYNSRNEIIMQYIPEKIEKYSVSTTRNHLYKSGVYYTVDFTITTSDGEKFYFDNNGFKSISDMKKATELLSDKPKTIEDDYWLDRFSRNLNKEDAQILLEIFDKN